MSRQCQAALQWDLRRNLTTGNWKHILIYCSTLFSYINHDGKTRLGGNGGGTVIGNLASMLRLAQNFIQARQIAHLYKADPDYSSRVAHMLSPV